MQTPRPPKRVENFTGAFLVTTGVLLFMALLTLAATLGYLAVVLVATGIDTSIRLLAATGRDPSRSRIG